LDFRDSPTEAAFRERLRSWLALHAKEFPSSGDEYWARQADWHQALYREGFFGLSFPREYGGQELPPVYDVIVDEELVGPGLRRAQCGLSDLRHRQARERRTAATLPAGIIDGTERWCQGFSEPAPARIWRR